MWAGRRRRLRVATPPRRRRERDASGGCTVEGEGEKHRQVGGGGGEIKASGLVVRGEATTPVDRCSRPSRASFRGRLAIITHSPSPPFLPLPPPSRPSARPFCLSAAATVAIPRARSLLSVTPRALGAPVLKSLSLSRSGHRAEKGRERVCPVAMEESSANNVRPLVASAAFRTIGRATSYSASSH